MSNADKIISSLNSLLTKNYDSEKGYKEAAEKTESPRLKAIFTRRAEQRYRFGHELKAELKALGGTPDKGTSVLGDLHRGWINFKTLFTSETDEAILEECARGEEACLEEYNEVLENTALTVSTRGVVENQRNSVKMALTQVEALEEAID